jgi:hypothetical protein
MQHTSQDFQTESLASCLTITQGCTSHRHQVAKVTQLCTVAPMGLQLNLLHVTLLVPGILKWLLGVWKICAPLPPPITKTVVTPNWATMHLTTEKYYLQECGTMWFAIQQKTCQRNAQQNIQTVTVEGMIGKYLSLISITRQTDPLNTIKHQHLLKIFSFSKQCFTTVVKLPYASGYLKCYCIVCEKCEYYWNRNRYKSWNKWHLCQK